MSIMSLLCRYNVIYMLLLCYSYFLYISDYQLFTINIMSYVICFSFSHIIPFFFIVFRVTIVKKGDAEVLSTSVSSAITKKVSGQLCNYISIMYDLQIVNIL